MPNDRCTCAKKIYTLRLQIGRRFDWWPRTDVIIWKTHEANLIGLGVANCKHNWFGLHPQWDEAGCCTSDWNRLHLFLAGGCIRMVGNSRGAQAVNPMQAIMTAAAVLMRFFISFLPSVIGRWGSSLAPANWMKKRGLKKSSCKFLRRIRNLWQFRANIGQSGNCLA